MSSDFRIALAEMPLVAILRGVRPAEAGEIGLALADAGFRLIEVPLNSPQPLESIAAISATVGSRAIIGAGTVLHPAQVAEVAAAGGRLIVSPNTDRAVIAETLRLGLTSLPGYFTPTEAFAAISAGADGLKLFPADAATPALVRAHRAVFPAAFPLLVVGGIAPENMGDWLTAGATGFGIGSALFRPGQTAQDVGKAAARFIAAFKSATA